MLRAALRYVASYPQGDHTIAHDHGSCLWLKVGFHLLSFLPLDAATSMISISYALVISRLLHIDDYYNKSYNHANNADKK